MCHYHIWDIFLNILKRILRNAIEEVEKLSELNLSLMAFVVILMTTMMLVFVLNMVVVIMTTVVLVMMKSPQ